MNLARVHGLIFASVLAGDGARAGWPLQPRQRSTPASLSAFSLVFFHVRSQQGIDPSLIAWSFFSVPVKHVAIDT